MSALGFSVGGVPYGVCLEYYGSTAPVGFAFPIGQLLNVADNPKLFAALGNVFGGDGVTTFGLPDRRGRAAFGKDDMGGAAAGRLTGQTGGIDGTALGGVGGAETHSIAEAELPAHTHSGSVNIDHQHDLVSAVTEVGGNSQYFSENYNGDTTATWVAGRNTKTRSGGGTKAFTTAATGGGSAHNILPPGIVCNYIMRVG